jgi:CheY-like chemotaxis protein
LGWISAFGFWFMNVLIVHRHLSFLQAVQEKFLLGGWMVNTATSGLEGLTRARERQFDLILCGTDLPVLSGIELIRNLRTNSINRNTPMFLVTENSAGVQSGDLMQQLEVHLVDDKELLADGVVKFGWLG